MPGVMSLLLSIVMLAAPWSVRDTGERDRDAKAEDRLVAHAAREGWDDTDWLRWRLWVDPVFALMFIAMIEIDARDNCGGDLPPCSVLDDESGDSAEPWRVWNGDCYMPTGSTGQCGESSASGKWQFVRGTWDGYDGYVNAADAPAYIQDEKARAVWAGGAGCSHWDAC